MTLDEAIKHAEEVAEEKEKQAWESQLQEEYEKIKPCKKCAEEHRQLAEWLKELKQLREQTRWIPCSERSPKKSGKYWCTFGGTNLTGVDCYTTESDAEKLFDDPKEYTGWDSKNVIAWMLMPESYEPQEK